MVVSVLKAVYEAAVKLTTILFFSIGVSAMKSNPAPGVNFHSQLSEASNNEGGLCVSLMIGLNIRTELRFNGRWTGDRLGGQPQALIYKRNSCRIQLYSANQSRTPLP